MARCWYSYIGGTGDPLMARSYMKMAHGKPGCFNGATVCAIYVSNSTVFPSSPLSPNIQTYIADALSELVAQPQFPTGSKYYVYMKS